MATIENSDWVRSSRDFYRQNYSPAFFWNSAAGSLVIGSREQPGPCRFCGRSPPTATFACESHAVPALLGKNRVISFQECDTCNKAFSRIEHDLGIYLNPTRTYSSVKGRKGLPYTKGKGWLFAGNNGALSVRQDSRSEVVYVDDQKRLVSFRFPLAPHRPRGVYKALCKIFISVMPIDELTYFRQCVSWLQSAGVVENAPEDGQNFLCFSTVSPFVNRAINIIILRRKSHATVPYATLLVGVGNELLQIFPPSEQNECLSDKPIDLMPWPIPHLSATAQSASKVFLAEPGVVSGVTWSRTFSYLSRTKTNTSGRAV